MIGWLLGIPELSGGQLRNIKITFTRVVTQWQWYMVFALMALAVVFVAWLYRREPKFITKKKKIFLSVLRVLGIWLVIMILCGPSIKLDKMGATKTNVVVMVDQSLSMSIKDRRVDSNDILRAAKVMGLTGWNDTGISETAKDKSNNLSRMELVEGLLKNKDVNLLEKLNDKFRLHTYLFSTGIEPYQWNITDDTPEEEVKPLMASGVATELGTSIRKIMEEFRGQPVGGVIMLTDGGMNQGEDPMITAEFAKNISDPIYPIGVGLPVARDIQLNYIFTNEIVFIEDDVPVYARVRTSGYSGETAPLKVYLGSEEVASEEITLQSGEETHLLHFTPKKAGEYILKVKAGPRDDELIDTNNERSKKIRVIDKKINVLVMESDPRWEFRYLKNALLRDKRIDLTIFLANADTDYSSVNKKYIRDLPKTKEELFKYDVIIFGNISRNQIPRQSLDFIDEFVSDIGGGLLLLSDRWFNPWEYSGTPIEAMTPVEFEPKPKSDPSIEIFNPLTMPFSIKLTPEGEASSIMRLAPEREENARIWREASEHYWYAPVTKAKPAASVLAVHASERNTNGDIPVVAMSRYGKGWVVWSGIDTFWRWRHKPGLKYSDRMWGQIVQHLSMVHILGESKRIQLGTDNSEYSVGDKVDVFARVLDKSYSPLSAERVTAILTLPSKETRELVLSGEPERPGLFSGNFITSEVGSHDISLSVDDQKAEVTFKVETPQIEFNNPEMRQELLENIAATTGGKFLRLDEVNTIFDEIEKKQKLVRERIEDDLWDAPLTILLFILLIGTEIFFRKRADLA